MDVIVDANLGWSEIGKQSNKLSIDDWSTTIEQQL
jgi:hypothetical protein